MYASKYFTEHEMTYSETARQRGVANEPTFAEWKVLHACGVKMDKVREALGVPIIVNSWFRNLFVNNLVGSRSTSQHPRGEAIDFVAPKFGAPFQVVQFLAEKMEELEIDQLILEHSWVHISFAINPTRVPRKNVLTLLENGRFTSGITNKKGIPLNASNSS